MTNIRRELCTEMQVHRFVTEASTLGWRPGFWPQQVQTDLGNGQPLIFRSFNGESAIYRQSLGCISVEIIND